MKQINIINRIEKERYKVDYGKLLSWYNISYNKYQHGEKTYITKIWSQNGNVGIVTDLKFREVLKIIEGENGYAKGFIELIEKRKKKKEMLKDQFSWLKFNGLVFEVNCKEDRRNYISDFKIEFVEIKNKLICIIEQFNKNDTKLLYNEEWKGFGSLIDELRKQGLDDIVMDLI